MSNAPFANGCLFTNVAWTLINFFTDKHEQTTNGYVNPRLDGGVGVKRLDIFRRTIS